MIPELTALTALLLTALAEWMHARRVRRVTSLAFGPEGKPREWVWLAPFARALAVAALVWGLVTLFLLDPKVLRPKKSPEGGYRHLVIVLDVCPRCNSATPVLAANRPAPNAPPKSSCRYSAASPSNNAA